MADQEEAYGLCVGGNGKLMKALPMLLADENRKAGYPDIPSIKVLSITGSEKAKDFIARLAQGKGYSVKIQGYKDGREIDEVKNVDIVKGGFAIDPKGDVAQELAPVIADIKAGKVKYITSNTYKGFETDYPKYLMELLKAGFDAGTDKVPQPIPVYPMELVANNGDVLKANVQKLVKGDSRYRDHAAGGRKFSDWLQHTYFANTTVDRIVADDAKDPGTPLAEAFAYIAIEKPKGDVIAPVMHPFGECPEIEQVDSIETAQTRKLGILNAMHTAMVQKWILEGRQPPGMTVRQFMDTNRNWMENVRKELVSVVGKWLPDANVEAYSQAIVERFMNPFNKHRLNEIATNHSVKIDQRLNLVLDWKAAHPDKAGDCETPTLDALMKQTISDRQLAAAKKAAVAIQSHGALPALLDEAMKVDNPQPHKGEDVLTRENLTTKASLTRALAGLESKLNSTLRDAPDPKTDDILNAYRTHAGITGGRVLV